MNLNMLAVGRFVKIHSLASEKARKHNGKTAVVIASVDKESGRCGVKPIDNSCSKTLSIKPTNLTILCSCCRMREEVTSPEAIVCERCQKESYCSNQCKTRYWEGANKESSLPNCHKAWCIPLHFEMQVPTQPIGESNVGEEAYEQVSKYLQLAVDIGNSGKRSEERAMLEKLIKVDPLQPSAYNNLFMACSHLAVMAERYKPNEYDELTFKAIQYLRLGIELLVSDEIPGGPGTILKSFDGPHDKMFKAFIGNINHKALEFIEVCMRGERGRGNVKLENIELCLERILALFDKQNEPMYKVHALLGFCSQKLMKYECALSQFLECCRLEKDDKFWYHSSLIQIPQCLSCVALYDDDRSPTERVELMEKAVSKFNEAIVVLKEDAIPVYNCQAKLGRCLYNKNSMLNQFAQHSEIHYSDKQKEDTFSSIRSTAKMALEGAVAVEIVTH